MVMRRAVVMTLALCAACEARIGATGDDNGVDASPTGDGSGSDAAPGIDAPACFNGRVVFLSFEGETLTKGATSDATSNHASWMQITSGTAPPYHAGGSNRTAEIQAIVDGVTAQLSGFPIIVVTTRPTSGQYVMIVYGGTPQQVGSRFNGAVQQLDCGDATRNDVAWVADNVTPNQKIVNFSIGAIGFGLGLTATLTTTDCMCGWDNACISDNTAACTLTQGITRDPNANQKCNGLVSQDETTTFSAAFCQ
jgi:hypothetical protein